MMSVSPLSVSNDVTAFTIGTLVIALYIGFMDEHHKFLPCTQLQPQWHQLHKCQLLSPIQFFDTLYHNCIWPTFSSLILFSLTLEFFFFFNNSSILPAWASILSDASLPLPLVFTAAVVVLWTFLSFCLCSDTFWRSSGGNALHSAGEYEHVRLFCFPFCFPTRYVELLRTNFWQRYIQGAYNEKGQQM